MGFIKSRLGRAKRRAVSRSVNATAECNAVAKAQVLPDRTSVHGGKSPIGSIFSCVSDPNAWAEFTSALHVWLRRSAQAGQCSVRFALDRGQGGCLMPRNFAKFLSR